MGRLNELERFNNFPWWGKVVALMAGVPLIGAAIVLAPFWLPVLLWGWWSDRKDRKNPRPWGRDK
jgi:hypothetical protein